MIVEARRAMITATADWLRELSVLPAEDAFREAMAVDYYLDALRETIAAIIRGDYHLPGPVTVTVGDYL